MKGTIFVTGVTRMRGGFVCVSGINEQGIFVRPEIHYADRPGIKNEYLFVDNKVVIKPLVKVELDFLRHVPKSAFHTEDWEIDGKVPPRLVCVPSDQEKQRILLQHTDVSLDRALCDQSRSLVIVRPQEVPQIEVELWEDKIKCRLSFQDESGAYHKRLPVTDVNWLAISKQLWREDRHHIRQCLSRVLQGKQIFLRIGVTREWHGQTWRQISGVFTTPDWLQGRCFADFGYDFTDFV